MALSSTGAPFQFLCNGSLALGNQILLELPKEGPKQMGGALHTGAQCIGKKCGNVWERWESGDPFCSLPHLGVGNIEWRPV